MSGVPCVGFEVIAGKICAIIHDDLLVNKSAIGAVAVVGRKVKSSFTKRVGK
jgi:hypothetical protein